MTGSYLAPRCGANVFARVLGAAALGGAVIAIAAGAATAAGRRPSAASVYPATRIAWSSCGRRLQCANVLVPLDWGRPRGRKITLAVIRYLAGRPAQRIGSLFFNFGGPGTPGVEAVKKTGAGLNAAFGGRFDTVSWDPRGAGISTHVRCFTSQRARTQFWGGVPDPITRPESLRYLPKTIAFAQRCRALSGWLLPYISTVDTARDLNYLRQLVGDPQLNYYGASYGTFLGQTYINMFPRRVRAVVLDGVLNPFTWTASTETALANRSQDTDLVFKKLESTCQSAGPTRCALAAHGAVAPRVNALLARLKRGSIPAPSVAPPRRLLYSEALNAILSVLNQPADWPQLATALDQAASGNGSALASAGRAGLADSRTVGVEGTQGILCADAPDDRGPNAWPAVIGHLTAVSFIGGPTYGWGTWAPCASWHVRAANRYTGPWHAHTKTPVLVVGTRYDPATPYANAQFVASILGNAVLLTNLGYGHLSTADFSTCTHKAIVRYVVDLVPPHSGTVCLPDRQPFDPNFGKPFP